VVGLTRNIGGAVFSIGYAYNAAGEVTDLMYPGGEVVHHAYTNGFLSSVIGAQSYASGLSYNTFGALTAMTKGNGDTNAYEFYQSGRLKRILQNAGALSSLQLTFDPVGNVLDATEQANSSLTQQFTYDDLGRMLTASGPYGARTYGYSPTGTLTAKDGATQTADPSHPHRIVSAGSRTLTYDAFGNVTGDGTRTFVYDGQDQMALAKQGTLVVGTYAYDTSGMRIRKSSAAGTVLFVRGLSGEVLAEASPQGNILTTYVYVGGQRIARSAQDTDGDGAPDAQDNCPSLANAGQADADADGLGDACDAAPSNPDRDGDGLLDGFEDANHNGVVDAGETNASAADTDGDGSSDGAEILVGTDPLDPGSHPGGSAIPALGFTGSAFLVLLLLGSAGIVLRRRRGPLDRAARTVLILFLVGAHLNQTQKALASTVTYLGEDHLGSARLGRTGSTTTQQIVYTPFGEVWTQSGQALRYTYTGQEFDAETGLYYYGARYYDPSLGRFLQADPIVADPFDPQMLNRYTYVRNSPASIIDPSGAVPYDAYYDDGGLVAYNDYGYGGPGSQMYPPTGLPTGPGPEQFTNAQYGVPLVQSSSSPAGALSVGAGFTAVRSTSGGGAAGERAFDPVALAGRLDTPTKAVFGGLAIAAGTVVVALAIAVGAAWLLSVGVPGVIVATYAAAPKVATVLEGLTSEYSGGPMGASPVPLGAAAVREVEGLAARGISGGVPRSRALSTIRVAGSDEAFVRFESTDVRFTKVTELGGLRPNTFAAPTSELPVPLAERATRFNLPDPQILRTRELSIRAPGDLVIGPRPVSGGTGNEVLFPFGTRPGTVK